MDCKKILKEIKALSDSPFNSDKIKFILTNALQEIENSADQVPKKISLKDFVTLYKGYISKGQDEKAIELLENNPDFLNEKLDSNKETPLHVATGFDRVSVVEYLLKKKAKQLKTKEKNLPIHYIKSVPVLNLLMKKKAINKEGFHDETPIYTAIQTGNLDLVKKMIDMGAKLDVKTSDFWETPLMVAVQSGKADIVELLLNNGAGVNDKNSRGYTALHFAVFSSADNKSSFKKIVDVLMKNGADASIIDRLGKKASDYGSEYGVSF